MHYYFDWDPNKAKSNSKKHRVSFELAATIFLDPRSVSVFDSEHSESEDRWATIGTSTKGTLLVVVHTFQQIERQSSRIRIISARKATRKEAMHYREASR